ncbi:unnamed protein product, partial [Laminaria digitata]
EHPEKLSLDGETFFNEEQLGYIDELKQVRSATRTEGRERNTGGGFNRTRYNVSVTLRYGDKTDVRLVKLTEPLMKAFGVMDEEGSLVKGCVFATLENQAAAENES